LEDAESEGDVDCFVEREGEVVRGEKGKTWDFLSWG
jgi:hypothetical protein